MLLLLPLPVLTLTGVLLGQLQAITQREIIKKLIILDESKANKFIQRELIDLISSMLSGRKDSLQ
jgi:hypothetical protein